MPDWTDTLTLRETGARTGFLSSNLPLEEQDEKLGGPLVQNDTPDAPDEDQETTKDKDTGSLSPDVELAAAESSPGAAEKKPARGR